MRTATVRATPPRLMPFSDSMVDAIREGRKTQTRRHVGKALPSWATSFESTPEGVLARGRLNNKPISKLIPCRYGKPGDRLAVREALARVDGLAHYAADGRPVIDVDSLDGTVPWKWKTSRLGAMYMPRHAVRTFLEITEVRIERLTKISEADAIAEGFDLETCGPIFRKTAGRAKQDFGRWLEMPDGREPEGYWCLECVEKAAKKHGARVRGWNDCFETDSTPTCEECGILLYHSPSEYAIREALWLTEEDDWRIANTSTSGNNALALAEICEGMGDWSDEYAGRMAQMGFGTLWESINGKGSWAADPYVFAITFRAMKGHGS